MFESINIQDLVPHPKNPNKHSTEQIKRLSELIGYQGWRLPIIVSKQSGYIVSGHGRLEAAKLMGLKVVPVSYQDFLSDEQEYAFLVSDNAIASWASLDLGEINLEIGNLGPDFEMGLLGLKSFSVDPPIMSEPLLDDIQDTAKKMKFYTCPNCEKEFEEKQAMVRIE